GARALTAVASNVKEEPRLLRLIPQSATCTPEPNDRKFDWMRLTITPSASAAHKYAVPPTCAAPGRGIVARCGSMSALRSAIQSAASISAGATDIASGSETYSLRS